MNEKFEEFLPYLITHPLHALVVIVIAGVGLIVILFAIFFAIRLKKQAVKTNGTHSSHCQCTQILPKITEISAKLDRQDEKIERQNEKICDIRSEISYIYGKFNNKGGKL